MNDFNFHEFDQLPERQKKEALRWGSIIKEFELYAEECGIRRRHEAMKDFCLKYRIEHPKEKCFEWRTLHGKIKRFNEKGLLGLVSKYQGRRPTVWPKEAQACLWQLFCNVNQPTASWCIRQLKIRAKKEGWDLPSYSIMKRFISQIPQETKDRHRKGEKYWRQHYVPSVLRDYESIVPGEMYVSDHQQVNVAVKHPSGRVIFPWLTAWADMRTRKIVGYTLAETPSMTTINISLKSAIEKYSLPEHVMLDNGRDYSSKQFTGGVKKRFRFKAKEAEIRGIYTLLGIEVHFCIPGNPQAKPIERGFWTQEINFQKAFPTYRGNNILNRPEGVDKRMKDEKHVHKWDDFLGFLKDYIDDFNQNHHHRGHGMNGRTPNEVWNEYFKTHARRQVSPSSLRLLMMKSNKVVVGRYGITALNNYYRSDTLMDHQGEQVIYRYDPGDLSELYVYDEKDSFICTAEKTHRTAWNDESAYKEIKRLEKRKRKALKEELEANQSLAKVEFGYQKREPSKEPKQNKSSKIVRIMRTELDGVQKKIDEQGVREGKSDNDQGSIINDYRKHFSIGHAQKAKEQPFPKEPFMRLTINDPYCEEDY